MTTIHVKAHTRKLKDKPADPFAAQINAKLAEREQRRVSGTVNEFRNSIGYTRKRSDVEIDMSRAIRNFQEFVSNLLGRV